MLNKVNNIPIRAFQWTMLKLYGQREKIKLKFLFSHSFLVPQKVLWRPSILLLEMHGAGRVNTRCRINNRLLGLISDLKVQIGPGHFGWQVWCLSQYLKKKLAKKLSNNHFVRAELLHKDHNKNKSYFACSQFLN